MSVPRTAPVGVPVGFFLSEGIGSFHCRGSVGYCTHAAMIYVYGRVLLNKGHRRPQSNTRPCNTQTPVTECSTLPRINKFDPVSGAFLQCARNQICPTDSNLFLKIRSLGLVV